MILFASQHFAVTHVNGLARVCTNSINIGAKHDDKDSDL